MFDDDDDTDDPLDNMVVLGFQSVEGLISFVEWVNDNFDDPDDLRDWFDENIALLRDFSSDDRPTKHHDFQCESCDASYATMAGLTLHKRVAHSNENKDDPFWQIINNSFKNHKEDPHDKLRGSD